MFLAGTSIGNYTTKSGYWLQIIKGEEIRPHGIWIKIWDMNLYPKIKLHIWRLCNNALATGENWRKRNIDVQHSCSLCKRGMKSTKYLFRE